MGIDDLHRRGKLEVLVLSAYETLETGHVDTLATIVGVFVVGVGVRAYGTVKLGYVDREGTVLADLDAPSFVPRWVLKKNTDAQEKSRRRW